MYAITWAYENTGEIQGNEATNDSATYQFITSPGYREGMVFVNGTYTKDTYYINLDFTNPTPTPRVEPYCTISGQTISNIHNLSTVDCGELGTYEVTDGTFEFTIDTPGTYQITVKSVPFLDKTFEVVIP